MTTRFRVAHLLLLVLFVSACGGPGASRTDSRTEPAPAPAEERSIIADLSAEERVKIQACALDNLESQAGTIALQSDRRLLASAYIMTCLNAQRRISERDFTAAFAADFKNLFEKISGGIL